jgi:hypothetical protein
MIKLLPVESKHGSFPSQEKSPFSPLAVSTRSKVLIWCFRAGNLSCIT